MRFAYVLLGLVALTKLDISSGICSNGLAGKQSGDYCCAASCDECSTSMCFAPFVAECCPLSIFNKCSATGEAPCVIDDGGVLCSNGIPGVEYEDNVCCEAQCGTCGGDGCETRPGGEEACCVGAIRESREMCSTTEEAPCIIKDVFCSNGVLGVENYDVCCEDQCVVCGGYGCDTRRGGAEACCSGTVKESGDLCSTTKEAPCLIEDGFCRNGVPGVEGYDVCCEAQCVTCGGFACETRPGGEDACCSGSIKESGEMCSTTNEAPCIIEGVYCSDGVAGVEGNDVCCDAQCGTCGGFGCETRPGGADACCSGTIKESGKMCSTTREAPCIITDGYCSNGVPGVEGYDVCCEAQCVTCGGYACETRPGGEDACCSGSIKESGEVCSVTNEAPCIIEGVYCSDGVPGVEGSDVCCDAQCGTCGGFGCETRPGGAEACCSGTIKESGKMCSTTKEAPCIITDGFCSNGVPGVEAYDVCCEAECVTCGGLACETRPGGEDACCSGTIKDSGEMCSTTMEAPCIIQESVAES